VANYENKIDGFLAVTKALADPNRVRALLAVSEHELCVCQVIELLELAPSTVSKHMAVLKGAGLVKSRKKGRWVYYRAAETSTIEEVRGALHWLCSCLGECDQICRDRSRLGQIVRLEPEQLCKIQTS
jgi:DNA-binding transcriptional ArsR family regulator